VIHRAEGDRRIAQPGGFAQAFDETLPWLLLVDARVCEADQIVVVFGNGGAHGVDEIHG